MTAKNYHEEMDIKNARHLRELLKTLPPFVQEFFRGIEQTTSSKTRIAYAYDLRVFFNYLAESHTAFKGIDITALDVGCLGNVSADDIEMYMDYLGYYNSASQDISKEYMNRERGKSRKLASLRTFYHYYYKKRKIDADPTMLVDLPKIHEKNIIRLEPDEVAQLLDVVESGKGLSDAQLRYHEHTKDRDLALMTLLLGTGIRVSECVGLNMADIDFSVNGIRIVRKGGSEVIVYFGQEVERALKAYLELRRKTIGATGHEDALFLSLQNKRLSVRSVQNLVKKYAQLVTRLKKISPHKLRSTYGTSLYRETGDIYLVADVLGHKDVNTTKRHYAQIEDERRRMAAKAVKLRDD